MTTPGTRPPHIEEKPLDSRCLSGSNGPHRIGQIGDGRTLRAIGLWPFWGSAIALKVKTNETRGWYRHTCAGLLAIYQTKTVNRDTLDAYKGLQEKTGQKEPFGIPHPKTLPLQSVVAVARVAGGVRCPPPGIAYAVRFLNGTGAMETRQIPPPETPESLLGYYDSGDSGEPRYAWILTDIMPLREPLLVPTGGGTRQGIFNLPDEIAWQCLRDYKAFILELRPKCKYCHCPVGGSIPTHTGAAYWKYDKSFGWRHYCPAMTGKEPFTPTAVLENPERIKAFTGGDFPDVPSVPLDDAFRQEAARKCVPAVSGSLFEDEPASPAPGTPAAPEKAAPTESLTLF